MQPMHMIGATGWKIRVFRGQAEITAPRTGAVRVRYSGACVVQHATAVTSLLDQWLEEGHAVHVIVDALDLECHAHAFGRHWRSWLERNAARLEGLEVLSLRPLDALSTVALAA